MFSFGGFLRNTPRITPMAHPIVDLPKPTTPWDSYPPTSRTVAEGQARACSTETAHAVGAGSVLRARAPYARIDRRVVFASAAKVAVSCSSSTIAIMRLCFPKRFITDLERSGRTDRVKRFIARSLVARDGSDRVLGVGSLHAHVRWPLGRAPQLFTRP